MLTLKVLVRALAAPTSMWDNQLSIAIFGIELIEILIKYPKVKGQVNNFPPLLPTKAAATNITRNILAQSFQHPR